MAIVFKHQGKIIRKDFGDPDPKTYIEKMHLPEDTEWDRVTFDEIAKMEETAPENRLELPDSIEQQVIKLRKQHIASLEILEEQLSLQKGSLRKAIDDRLKEK